MAEVTNEDANDLADEILGREQFLSASEPGIFQRSVDRVLEAIAEVIGRVFSAIFGGAGGAAGTGIAIALATVAALLLLFAIYRAITNRTPKEKTPEAGARVVFDEVVEPEALRTAMARHVADQQWREAVIAGFRLAIVELIDLNIAREISGATTGDFAAAVRDRRSELLEDYEAGARSFERAFYSDLTITENDMSNVQRLLSRLARIDSSPRAS